MPSGMEPVNLKIRYYAQTRNFLSDNITHKQA